ncbi:uncharacterized protein LOC107981736 [Nasonia vitripennis]|uniref:Uncharacterized protein n=1 Tax=Nasonia vitripennis TaxID=7425 RepID=A0A7M7M2I7_NASVI|nr:uncharacterized protein LOC107981736 [Nasonia vitripennis]XP_016843672.1 uncharacterized protein LOC107981736 [Nasonia vitripennis]XP_016843673.1 uncharacterized protein LOC107981736 [Nasonia vitripennis]XP_031781560.1 uncharacterized protein LOC107981736 [Nasonia vitripennis]
MDSTGENSNSSSGSADDENMMKIIRVVTSIENGDLQPGGIESSMQQDDMRVHSNTDEAESDNIARVKRRKTMDKHESRDAESQLRDQHSCLILDMFDPAKVQTRVIRNPFAIIT